MKRFLLFTFTFLFTSFIAFSQTVEFSDDFESGTANWTLEGAWGTTTAQSNSPNNSLTDSPGGDYLGNQNISATMATGVDLSGPMIFDASVKFWAIYDIEGGNFDYCYVEASGDGGSTWINIATFLGEGNLTPWVEYTYSLGGFVGSSDVRVRFRFFSDGGYEVDGIYIDDFSIQSDPNDNSAPLILHNSPQFYESNLGDITMIADLVDPSGIAVAELKYTVDGGGEQTVSGTNLSMDTWSFVIPAQAAGAQVDYHLEATDNSSNSNMGASDVFPYIAGHHIFYDNSQVDFVNSFGPDGLSGLGCAVRVTLDGTTDIVYALIRNYTDINRPNDDFEFHIWADDNGLPGADVITPFMVTPEANLTITSPMTRVDLSAYSTELSGLTGDFFVGYTVPTGETWLVQTTPAVGGRTYTFDGITWTADTANDFHFRVVTTQFATPDDCGDAADLSSMVGQGPDNPQTSPLWDNSNATVAGTEPTDGFDCWFDATIENPLWYTFVGDGGTYQITTTNCNGTVTNYIEDGDAQIAIYSGNDCANLTPVACNDDGEVEPDLLAPIVELETMDGTTYYMMVDGYLGSSGEYCVEITELSVITCADISIGTSTGEADVCFGETTVFTIDGVVIPTSPVNGFIWIVTSEDVSGSGDPFNETSFVGNFGETNTPYAPALLNDGTQLPAATYFFSPVVWGSAIDTDGTLGGYDFTNGCVETGTSIEVNLYPEFDDITGTGSSVDETDPPGNNGEASVDVDGGSASYTYNWSNGGDTQTITGLAGGDYTVTVSDATGCVDDLVITVTVDVITGTNDPTLQQSIELYPNPAKDFTTLMFEFEEAKDLQLRLFNNLGQRVLANQIDNVQSGNFKIDLQDLSSGIYFLNISDGENSIVNKLIVE